MSNARHSTLYFCGPRHTRIIEQLNENKRQKIKYGFHSSRTVSDGDKFGIYILLPCSLPANICGKKFFFPLNGVFMRAS